MFGSLLVIIAGVLALGMVLLAAVLRLSTAQASAPIALPVPKAQLDSEWLERPIQTFTLQVQVARYWQPPFKHR
jgi:hypothetical protein